MSFYAGNKKLHVSKNTREKASLDTDTIYPDTVFHSNMKMLCSLGEYTVVPNRVQYYIENKEFPTNIQTEYCFEGQLPQAVKNALAANYVVLTSMGDFAYRVSNENDTMLTGFDVAVSFPLNIKTGRGLITDSGNSEYGVAVSPQITTGGILDVSYSVNAIANRTISVNANLEGGYASSSGSTNKIMGWSSDPDYATPGGKVPNLKRGVSNYFQYHARGNRWKLSNYTIYAANSGNKIDNPVMNNLDNIPTPKFHFIILNVQFLNGTFNFINPITETTTPTNDIKLSSGQILVNGVDLTTLKVLMSTNTSANSYIDFANKSLNKVPSPTVYTSSIDMNFQVRNHYTMWNSVNFMQGAKFNNQKLSFLPCPGLSTSLTLYDRNSLGRTFYRDPSMYIDPMLVTNSWDISQQLGYPCPGASHFIYGNTYYRHPQHLLFTHHTTNPLKPESSYHSFALLDTSNFTGLYIDKDGIKGTYNGMQIPIYNTLSTPTYMLQTTQNLIATPTYFSSSDWTSEGIHVSTYIHDYVSFSYNIVDTVSFLLCLELAEDQMYWSNMGISGGRPIGGGNYQIPSNDFAIFGTDRGCNIAAVGGKEYAVIKMQEGEELVLTQGYLHSSLKYYANDGVSSQGSLNGGVNVDNLQVYYIHTLRMVSQQLQLWGKMVIDVDYKRFVTGSTTVPPADVSLLFSQFKAPALKLSILRIQ